MTRDEFILRASSAIRGSADDLRALGFTVAVHNDYQCGGKPYTFWLLTKKMGDVVRAFKGEGESDGDALDSVRAEYAKASDTLRHAPMCPANHYHGRRVPSGPCSCGAVAMQQKSS